MNIPGAFPKKVSPPISRIRFKEKIFFLNPSKLIKL